MIKSNYRIVLLANLDTPCAKNILHKTTLITHTKNKIRCLK